MNRYRVLAIALAVLAATAGVRAQEMPEGYFITPDKVRIFYKIVGSGTDALVAVHGGPGNSLESIRADLGPLAKNRRVIYYDQRGQGRSEVITDGSKLGYKDHVADLEALRVHFKLERMTLYGNSWGGLLISLYAIAHPDRIERMVLGNAAGPMRGFLDDMGDEISRRTAIPYNDKQRERLRFVERSENWLKAKDVHAVCKEFFTGVLHAYTYTRTLDGYKGDLCGGPAESVRNWRATNMHAWASLGDFDLVDKLGAVKAPVLIIHGVADVIPVRASQFWAVGYPNARLLLIEKSGHISHVERADVFFPAVETFLAGEYPAGAKKVVRGEW